VHIWCRVVGIVLHHIFVRQAIIQLISDATHTRWRGNLKGLSIERGWKKSAENLGTSPLKRDYSLIPLSAKSISLDSPFKWDSLTFSIRQKPTKEPAIGFQQAINQHFLEMTSLGSNGGRVRGQYTADASQIDYSTLYALKT
jgi:hypothetical protein